MSEVSLIHDFIPKSIIQQENSIESGDWSATAYQGSPKLPIRRKKDQLKTLIPFSSVSPFLHFDSSSVLPHFHSRIETSFLENRLPKEIKAVDILQSEIIFRMPPISKSEITVRIRKVQKAEIRVFKPEEV